MLKVMFAIAAVGIFAPMLRAIAAIGLIGLLFSNVFLKSFVLLDFKIHQEIISQTICVQKDEVKNTCNGKCHLTKQLEKTEESSEDAPVLPENLREAILYFTIDNEVVFESFEETVIQIPRIKHLSGINATHSIFHPPQII
ncbi:MAG: hypothetical protein H6602_07735 [Flavobacteriales bacterium]|nr:hypothetical protein [Flavobacteriales bacterium]